MTSAKTNFDISKLAEAVYEAYSFAAAQKGLRFTFSVSHKIPRILHGDALSIKKALSSITQMAIEDSKGGNIELNVDLQKGQDPSALIIKFSVHDSSKQIPYWFSASLHPVVSNRINMRKIS